MDKNSATCLEHDRDFILNRRAPKKRFILIAGPTASGKSQLAVALARAQNGVVINADSMQVYDVLNVLSARPAPYEMAGIAHFLYGTVSPAISYSTGLWLEAVEKLLASKALEGKCAIFVGGTGLYFRALLGGLAEMPEIPEAIRAYWRGKLTQEGAEKLHALLALNDPSQAERLNINDGQRIVRALEVWDATGKSIGFWQSRLRPALIDEAETQKIVLKPEREWLVNRISMRLDQMVEQGALDEVKALNALRLDPMLPAMKAIGVREFSAYFNGNMSLDAALEKAKIETRRYAKRQMTWFRNQFGEDWQAFGDGAEAARQLLSDNP